MAGIEAPDFGTPDEVRRPPKTVVDLLNIGGGQVGRYTFEPGWRWSEHIKPMVKTDSCQIDHIGCLISGTLRATQVGGPEVEVKAGSVYRIPPGHDGWNPGPEPAVAVEFQGAATFAKG